MGVFRHAVLGDQFAGRKHAPEILHMGDVENRGLLEVLGRDHSTAFSVNSFTRSPVAP